MKRDVKIMNFYRRVKQGNKRSIKLQDSCLKTSVCAQIARKNQSDDKIQSNDTYFSCAALTGVVLHFANLR